MRRLNETEKQFEDYKIKAFTQLKDCQFLGSFIARIGVCGMKLNRYNYFESIVKSIVSQQLSLKAAATIERRLTELVDDIYTAENFIRFEFSELKSCGLSKRKAEYVQLLAQQSYEQRIPYTRFNDMSDQDIIDELVKLKGVGQWTAQMFIMWTMGRPDVFAPLDLGIQKGMKIVFNLPEFSVAEMEVKSQRWAPFRSIACWYLWRIQEM